jgi:transketolase
LRKRLISLLTERAKFDPRPFLLVGDLGFGVVEEFEGQFPKRFLNVGVSEQAGIGFSAGLAKDYLPFFYSIGNFSSFRALEQIRNDVAHEGWPVVIVSLGSGFSYGTAGYSHHAIEDAGAVASIMGMDVFTPSCVHEMEHVLSMHWENPRPMYLRLGSAEKCNFNHPINPLGSFSTYKDHSGGVALLAHGEIVHQALHASELLEKNLAIFSVFHYNRLSKELIETLKKFDKIVTLEEHFVEGGFGMRVRASLPSTSTQSFKCLGIQEYDSHMSGSRASMLARVGLDPESIAHSVKSLTES